SGFCSGPDCERRRVPASGGAFLSLLCSFSLCYIVVSLTLSALSDALLWRLPELVFTAGKLRLRRRFRCGSLSSAFRVRVKTGFEFRLVIWRPERFSADSLLVLLRIGDGASCSVSLSARARVVSGCVAVIFSVGFRVWFKFGGQALFFFFSVNYTVFVCPSRFIVSPVLCISMIQSHLPNRFLGFLDSPSTASSPRRRRVQSRFSVPEQGAVLFLVWKVMKIKTQWFLLTSPSSGLVDGVWSSVFLLGRSFCQFSAVGA
ncbi:LOW QUALITY PROTEIN: hypothetical protein HID58_070978, partial [Brassica napus]